jgi:hypothetical protein
MESGRFGSLALELYELLSSPSGAALDSVASKPTLIGLNYVQAKARISRRDASEMTLSAIGARNAIKSASNGLTERLHSRDAPGVDYGSAARTLLALEPGTETWSLAARRARAAKKLCLTVRHLSKNRYTPKYTPSYELELMDALAQKMLEEEFYFATQAIQSQTENKQPSGWTSQFEVLFPLSHDAESVSEYISALNSRSMVPVPAGTAPAQFDPQFMVGAVLLTHYDKLTYFAEPLANLPEWDGTAPVGSLDGPTLMRILSQLSPLSVPGLKNALDGFWDNANIQSNPYAHEESQRPLHAGLSTWLDKCRCKISDTSTRDCPVHLVAEAAERWRELADYQWQCMSNVFASPREFGYVYKEAPLRHLGLRQRSRTEMALHLRM